MNTEKPTDIKEPSVLDYLKAKLKFWDRSQEIMIPGDEDETAAENPADVQAKPPKTTRKAESVIPDQPVKVRQPVNFPWRALLALGFALIGQRMWEPASNRMAGAGLFFYALAILFLLWAYLRKEWTLSPLPETGSQTDSLRVRPIPLVLGVLLSAAAFLFLGGNKFTILNVSLWLLAIVTMVWAFRLPPETRTPLWPKIRDFFTRNSWQVNLTRWGLLVLAVAGVVIFFRIYNIAGVPSEPFSDHAEKILDVYDITQGQTRIFFPRNTGREAIQMYLTLVVSWVFGTGLSFQSLKIGTVICGLATLPYLYLLGKEFGGKRIGLLAVFFAGIAYWPNVISRVGLRFPLYPLFVAPVLYYLLRGLRTRSRNDMIISGLFLGFGLHGYNPFRVVPILVVIAVGLYLVHLQSKGNRKQAVIWLAVLAVVSLVVFLPLARYWLEDPQMFNYRIMTRLTDAETALPGPVWQVFLSNVWNGLRMFNWDDGEIWVNSVTHRPALDVVSAALFLFGVILVAVRYIRQRHWQDLFLLISIPFLQLPSTLSLAFPAENPALNRAGGALVPAFLLVALALDGLFTAVETRMRRGAGLALITVLGLALGGVSAFQNYDLVFNRYSNQFTQSAWNTSDMGHLIDNFRELYGTTEGIWVVPYPYWVDTRLPGVWAGIPNHDFALWPDQFADTLSYSGPKLIIVKGEDQADLDALKLLYPNALVGYFQTEVLGHDFYTISISGSK